MNFGFDAKRAYHNHTGLGHYSRTLIELLSEHYPGHTYYLFNPKPSSRYRFTNDNIVEVLPGSLMSNLFRSAWRSSWVKKDLKKLGIDLYHGLSHEIPIGVQDTGIPAIVTIHDLIHERYPDQYKAIDRRIYTRKYKNACRHAARIIATSQQTRQDLVDMYAVDGNKIDVCYQSCSPLFARLATEADKQRVRDRYQLPERFLLSVGTIIERKNLLTICKAYYLLRDEPIPPLLVVGKGKGKYYQQVKDFIVQFGLGNRIRFLSEDPQAATAMDWLSTADLSIMYQLGSAMLYPSSFEGFGMPVMEALWAGLPVITSNQSCLPEVGGDAALYVNPLEAEDIADAIRKVIFDEGLAAAMRVKGFLHTEAFAPARYVQSVMDVYNKVL
jgi:glycosyltransferase involved in cell wall biosynthesis